MVFAWYEKLRGRQFQMSPGSAEAYLAATTLVVVGTLARWGLTFLDPTIYLPFTTFYPAVLFAAYLGGIGVGIFAATLGGLIAWWAFLPHYTFLSLSLTDELELLAYGLACALIIWGAHHHCRLTDRLQNEEKLRKLAVEELAHRLKNKIASIQSIISFQLREQPRLRDDMIARLVALSATDDLIMVSQGQGASICAILSAELKPYGLSRISMAGPDILLTPTLALTMALIVHELATNAAKYGALSSVGGKLSIRWTLTDRTLNIEWRESGGPSVAAPSHRGFGLQVLSRALEQFSGAVQPTFERSGLICTMKAVLPESTRSNVPAVEPSRIKVAE